MNRSRLFKIEELSNDKDQSLLKDLLIEYTQQEIDNALATSIAYSQIKTSEYLLSLGADITWANFDGCYYAAHNNELEGLKFAFLNGVDVNVRNGMILNTIIITSINEKKYRIVRMVTK